MEGKSPEEQKQAQNIHFLYRSMLEWDVDEMRYFLEESFAGDESVRPYLDSLFFSDEVDPKVMVEKFKHIFFGLTQDALLGGDDDDDGETADDDETDVGSESEQELLQSEKSEPDESESEPQLPSSKALKPSRESRPCCGLPSQTSSLIIKEESSAHPQTCDNRSLPSASVIPLKSAPVVRRLERRRRRNRRKNNKKTPKKSSASVSGSSSSSPMKSGSTATTKLNFKGLSKISPKILAFIHTNERAREALVMDITCQAVMDYVLKR